MLLLLKESKKKKRERAAGRIRKQPRVLCYHENHKEHKGYAYLL